MWDISLRMGVGGKNLEKFLDLEGLTFDLEQKTGIWGVRLDTWQK